MCAKRLAIRMLLGERLELADELCPAAEGEVGVDATFEGDEAELFEAADLCLRERLAGQVGECGAAPEGEGLAEEPCCVLRWCVLRVGEEPLEAQEVELVRFQPDQVAGLSSLDQAVGSERLPQLGDVVLERVRGSPRRLRAPELVDQPVRGHDLVGGCEQQHEQRSQPRSLERERTICRRRPRAGPGSGTPRLSSGGDRTSPTGSVPPQRGLSDGLHDRIGEA